MSILIESTPTTPKIVIDSEKGEIFFGGISLPEDAQDFFAESLKEIRAYILNPKEATKVVFQLEYFNTSTTVVLRDILLRLNEAQLPNCQIEWFYEVDDEQMKDVGEGYRQLFGYLDLKLVSIDNFDSL